MAHINPNIPGTVTDKGDYIEFYYPDRTDKADEDSIQISCVNFRQYNAPHLLAFHTANEGNIPIQYRVKMRKKGMLPGVSDDLILGNHNGFLNVAIEIKRSTKSLSASVSADEKAFLRGVRERGGFSAVVYGLESYIRALIYVGIL